MVASALRTAAVVLALALSPSCADDLILLDPSVIVREADLLRHEGKNAACVDYIDDFARMMCGTTLLELLNRPGGIPHPPVSPRHYLPGQPSPTPLVITEPCPPAVFQDELLTAYGTCLEFAGRPYDAYHTYKSVVTRSPHVAIARLNLAALYHRHSHFGEAIALYESMLADHEEGLRREAIFAARPELRAEADEPRPGSVPAPLENLHLLYTLTNLAAGMVEGGRQLEAPAMLRRAREVLKLTPHWTEGKFGPSSHECLLTHLLYTNGRLAGEWSGYWAEAARLIRLSDELLSQGRTPVLHAFDALMLPLNGPRELDVGAMLAAAQSSAAAREVKSRPPLAAGSGGSSAPRKPAYLQVLAEAWRGGEASGSDKIGWWRRSGGRVPLLQAGATTPAEDEGASDDLGVFAELSPGEAQPSRDQAARAAAVGPSHLGPSHRDAYPEVPRPAWTATVVAPRQETGDAFICSRGADCHRNCGVVSPRPLPSPPLRAAWTGYDWYDHPAAHLAIPALTPSSHYSGSNSSGDGVTHHIFSYGPDTSDLLWEVVRARGIPSTNIEGLGHQQGAETMHATVQPHIALDIQLQLRGARPQVLAFRPAPVQASFGGMPHTAGASWLDFLYSDVGITPPEATWGGRVPRFSESLLIMPDHYMSKEHDPRALAVLGDAWAAASAWHDEAAAKHHAATAVLGHSGGAQRGKVHGSSSAELDPLLRRLDGAACRRYSLNCTVPLFWGEGGAAAPSAASPWWVTNSSALLFAGMPQRLVGGQRQPDVGPWADTFLDDDDDDATSAPPRGSPVVFACTNKIEKVDPGSFAVWMGIVARAPGSSVWLMGPGNSQTPSEVAAVSNLRDTAAAMGVHPSRLRFLSWINLRRHVVRMLGADVFLDTLVYGAHSTALDALRTGMPIVTLAGETMARRVAARMLEVIGPTDSREAGSQTSSGADFDVSTLLVTHSTMGMQEAAVRLAGLKSNDGAAGVGVSSNHLLARLRRQLLGWFGEGAAAGKSTEAADALRVACAADKLPSSELFSSPALAPAAAASAVSLPSDFDGLAEPEHGGDAAKAESPACSSEEGGPPSSAACCCACHSGASTSRLYNPARYHAAFERSARAMWELHSLAGAVLQPQAAY